MTDEQLANFEQGARELIEAQPTGQLDIPLLLAEDGLKLATDYRRLRELERACLELREAPPPDAAPLRFQRAYITIGRLLEKPHE